MKYLIGELMSKRICNNLSVRNESAWLIFSLVIFTVCVPVRAEKITSRGSTPVEKTLLVVGQQFESIDSLDISNKSGKITPKIQKQLNGLAWPKQKFGVKLTQADSGRGDYLVSFASPVATNNAGDNTVTMEWYAAKNEQGQIVNAPAIVVVHEAGSGMTVGQIFAKTLNKRRFHTFLVHLPGYGKRKSKDRRDVSQMVTLFHQGICDVRRARDAVAVLPKVDDRLIVLQGTSLGGFVCATVAGLDRGYDATFLMLAGGDLYDILMHGKKDAAKVLEKTRQAGISDEQLRIIIDQIEPLHLASRINSERIWLYSGTYDTVVPIRNANLLAQAANISKNNHILMPTNHYTGIIYLPAIFRHIGDQMKLIAATKGIANGG